MAKPIKLNDWKVTMADLKKFEAKLAKFLNAYRVKHYPMLGEITVEIEVGPKYARVWRLDGGKCAYAFIDMANGDLLKPDGWKRPAKHARGNIYNKNALEGCGPYGMAYLR